MEALLVLAALGLTSLVGLLALLWGVPGLVVIVLARTVDDRAAQP